LNRVWVKGANDLWSSFDPVIRRQRLAKRAKDRITAIGERFEAVMVRNGWKRNERKRWVRAMCEGKA
jgi:hypothetical protein